MDLFNKTAIIQLYDVIFLLVYREISNFANRCEQMRKFLLHILGFTCFLLVTLAVVTGCLVKYSKDNHIYLDEYGKKVELLRDTPSPRVIFLGGSNLAFGIDSKMVSDSLGINVVNYGLQAGMGLKLMMQDAIQYCSEGDILVIAPEYEHFFGNAYGESGTLSVLALLYPGVVRNFDMRNSLVVANGLKDALFIMSSSFVNKISGNVEFDYPYSALSFNDYGDEIRHWTYTSNSMMLKPNALVSDFDDSYFREFTASLQALEAKGVEVVIVPPSIFQAFYDNYEDGIHLLADNLTESGYPFAIVPEKMVFPAGQMFDSYYHLSKEGIDRRMVMIIDILRQQTGLANGN